MALKNLKYRFWYWAPGGPNLEDGVGVAGGA